MFFHDLLAQREAQDRPLRVGLIGAGKFGTMYAAQARTTPGVRLTAVADLYPERARAALLRAGWPETRIQAPSFEEAIRAGGVCITDDSRALIRSEAVEIVVDATGDPRAGIAHVLECCRTGKHVIMVNVEADALAGPLLARRAQEAGVVYSLAYGDQPALICELVDWARTCGFEVVAAGKGTKYLPSYHAITPDTVWEHFGFTEEQIAHGGFNPRMFSSFIDGTKAAIEMAAVANATGLTAPREGLGFPPCGVEQLAEVLRPQEEGGQLRQRGSVEVVSSLDRDGRPVERDIQVGVFVTFEAGSEYVERCFGEYRLVAAEQSRYAALWRPFHLIGLELGISVASVGLLGQPTGAPRTFNADVVAVAKRELTSGEVLDGEGGYTVWGRLMPAADSLTMGALPAGLAHGVPLRKPVAAGKVIRWADVGMDESDTALKVRREMEAVFVGDHDAGAAEARAS